MTTDELAGGTADDQAHRVPTVGGGPVEGRDMQDSKTRTIVTPQGVRPLADVLEEYPPEKRVRLPPPPPAFSQQCRA